MPRFVAMLQPCRRANIASGNNALVAGYHAAGSAAIASAAAGHNLANLDEIFIPRRTFVRRDLRVCRGLLKIVNLVNHIIQPSYQNGMEKETIDCGKKSRDEIYLVSAVKITFAILFRVPLWRSLPRCEPVCLLMILVCFCPTLL